MLICFYSSSGNTARFTRKLDYPSAQICESLTVGTGFVLFTPTYGSERTHNYVPTMVKRFLAYNDNYRFLKGVVGFGNRNFGVEYAVAGDIVSAKYNVPLLGRVELFGLPGDDSMIAKQIQYLLEI